MVYLYTFHFSLESQELVMTVVPSVSHVLVEAREHVCAHWSEIWEKAAVLSLLWLIDSTLVHFVTSL